MLYGKWRTTLRTVIFLSPTRVMMENKVIKCLFLQSGAVLNDALVLSDIYMFMQDFLVIFMLVSHT